MLGIFSCLYPMADCQFGYLALWGREGGNPVSYGLLEFWVRESWPMLDHSGGEGSCDLHTLLIIVFCFFFPQGRYFDRCPNYSSEPACEGALGYNSSQRGSTGRLLWLSRHSSWICAWPVWWQCLREHVWVGKEISTEQNRGTETLFLPLRSYVCREITQFRVVNFDPVSDLSRYW